MIDPENLDMQEMYLAKEHARISGRLLLEGISPDIVAKTDKRKHVKGNTGVATDGVEFLDRLFVPTFSTDTHRDRKIRVLSLAAIDGTSQENSRGFKYFGLGIVSEFGTLQAVFNEDLREAAMTVAEEAEALLDLQEEGILPNLEPHLLGINRPDRAMTANPLPPVER